jgi:conjugal transfer pilus assembly protein TraB
MMNQYAEQFRTWWVELPTKLRLMVMVVIAAVPAYLMVDVMFPEPVVNTAPSNKYTKPASVFATNAGVDKMDAQHTEAKLEAMSNQIKVREQKIDAKELEQKAAESRLQSQIDQSRLDAATNAQKMSELARQVESLSTYITKNLTTPQGYQGGAAQPGRQAATPAAGQFTLNPIMKQQQLNQPQVAPSMPIQHRPLTLNRGDEVLDTSQAATDIGGKPLTKAESDRQAAAKKLVAQNDSGDVNTEDVNTGETWLSAGTVLTGTLVTGHNVPTSGNANRDPAPVMIKITKEGIMPNNFSIDLRGCIVIGSARGDLSTRRVSIRAETISCINEQGEAIEQPLMASVQGPDGQGGMPAKMVTLFGESVKQSAIAGVYGTLAETAKGMAMNNSNNTTNNQPQFSGVLGTAAAGGAVSGFDKIADFYLELANEARPYLEMQPGIEGVDLVIQRGQSLKWKG